MTTDGMPNALKQTIRATRCATCDQRSADLERRSRALRSRNQIGDSNRSGRTWFIFTRAPLRDKSGIERLFRSWGGEALYNSHEDDHRTGSLVRGIGSPRIVVAAVPVVGLQCFMDVGERLINVWCAKRGICTGHNPNFEGYVRNDVSGQSILRIISSTDAELTRHTNSDEPL